MKRYFVFAACLSLAAGAVFAATKEQKRLEKCGVVMQEILNIPDNLPQQVLAKSRMCHRVSLRIEAGPRNGQGLRPRSDGLPHRQGIQRTLGAPAMYALEGDSLGMQIGGESTALILLVMNQKGVASILSSKIKLGGDASAAAGPKGRDASADTDLWMKAEILSYSRSRGLFAGISLEGSTLRPDNKADERIYHRKIRARAILLENRVATPATGRHLVRVLQTNSPCNESKQVASKY